MLRLHTGFVMCGISLLPPTPLTAPPRFAQSFCALITSLPYRAKCRDAPSNEKGKFLRWWVRLQFMRQHLGSWHKTHFSPSFSYTAEMMMMKPATHLLQTETKSRVLNPLDAVVLFLILFFYGWVEGGGRMERGYVAGARDGVRR